LHFGRISKRCSGGWSLVEILVIVACIAILAGILFPFLARARAMAYQTKCVSNLNQLANAFHAYAQDWDDRWPAPGGLAGNWSYWSQSGRGGLQGYIKQRGNGSVFCCPCMPEWKSFLYAPRTYCMNSYLREPADVEYTGYPGDCRSILKGIRVQNIPEERNTILMFEGVPLTVGWENDPYFIYIYRCCNWTRVRGYYPNIQHTIDPGIPWHGKFNNYVYCDGHIKTRRPGRKTRGEWSTHNEMYEWYVSKARFETDLWPTQAKQGVPYE